MPPKESKVFERVGYLRYALRSRVRCGGTNSQSIRERHGSVSKLSSLYPASGKRPSCALQYSSAANPRPRPGNPLRSRNLAPSHLGTPPTFAPSRKFGAIVPSHNSQTSFIAPPKSIPPSPEQIFPANAHDVCGPSAHPPTFTMAIHFLQ